MDKTSLTTIGNQRIAAEKAPMNVKILKLLIGIFSAIMILVFEFRYSQLSQMPVRSFEKVLWMLGSDAILYNYLMQFTEGTSGLPKKLEELQQSPKNVLTKMQNDNKANLISKVSAQQRSIQAFVGYAAESDFKRVAELRNSFNRFSERPEPALLAVAIFTWGNISDVTNSNQAEVKMLAGLYISSIDLGFIGKTLSLADKIEDIDIRRIYLAYAQVQEGDAKLAKQLIGHSRSQTYSKIESSSILLSELAAGLNNPIQQFEFLETAVKNQEKHDLLLAFRGYTLLGYQMQNFEQALVWLSRFKLEEPENSWILYWNGLANKEVGKLAEAAITLAAIPEKDEIYSEAQLELVTILNQSKRFEDAKPVIGKLVQRMPSSVPIKIQYAINLKETGSYTEAISQLEWLERKMPRDFNTAYMMGQIYFYHLNNFERASEYFLKAMTIKPGDPQLRKTMNDMEITRQRSKR